MHWRKETGAQGGKYSILFARQKQLINEEHRLATKARAIQGEIKSIETEQFSLISQCKLDLERHQLVNRVQAGQRAVRGR